MLIDAGLSHILLNEQENLSRQNPYVQVNTPSTSPSNPNDPQAVETVQRSAPRDIVQFQGIEIDLDDLDALHASENDEDGEDQENNFDIRNLTPREMVDMSMDLYIDGSLSYDEYSMLAFQVEFHPDFEDTIGALTGERADPDRPRDFIVEWEDRYNFERRYPSDNAKTLKQIDRILNVLHNLEAPLDFVA
jgi:hypothetical protein